MGAGEGSLERVEHWLRQLDREVSYCATDYGMREWGRCVLAARKGAECIAKALLEAVKPGRSDLQQDQLLQLVQRLRSERLIDEPTKKALDVVGTAGNMGAHAQEPNQEPTLWSARLCTVNLVAVLEWFLREALSARGISSASTVSALEELNAALRGTTEAASLEEHALHAPLEPRQRDGVRSPGEPMTDLQRYRPARPADFAAWYVSVRSILREIMPEDLAELERREGWERPDHRASPALHMCVIGEAAVGKSTLVNCLLSDRLSLLPAGGVGPHTAAAIFVRYTTDPFFEARYVGNGAYNNLLTALERDPDPDALAAARLLTLGDQYADASTAWLREVMRDPDAFCLDGAPPAANAAVPALRKTVALLQSGRRTVRHMAGTALPTLMAELGKHASGSLAPLTESVDLGWDADLLAPGLALVDLPGFGIANDKHQRVTKRELARARGVLWVVSQKGLMTGTLAGLRDIELFEQLAMPGPEWDVPRLTVVATRLDESAYDFRKRPTGERPSFENALVRMREEAVSMIRAQLREALAPLGSDAAINRALGRIDVHAVAPLDHRRCFIDDEEEPPRVASVDATGIPALKLHLRSLAAARRAHAATCIDDLLETYIETCAPAAQDVLRHVREELRDVIRDPGHDQ